MRGKSIVVRVAVLAILSGALATFAPASASAVPCASGTTTWTGAAADNNFATDTNWNNGGPSGACDATITAATAPVILAGTASVQKFTLGSNQTLKLQDGAIPTLNAVSIQNNGTIQLGCPVTASCGGPQPALNASSAAADAFANAGTLFSAGPGNAAGNTVRGNVTNTGTFQVDDFLRWDQDTATLDTFTNKGTISIATTCTTGVCMYSGTLNNTFVNDTGGNITNNGGSKYLQIDSGNFTQGAGNTSVGGPVAPVVMRGNLTMTGAASTAEIQPYDGGMNVSGTVGPGQKILLPSGSPMVVPSGTLITRERFGASPPARP